MIDILEELRAEASYHYTGLFNRAADEIQMLRKALNDIAAVTFCPKCQSKMEVDATIASRIQDAFDLGFKAAGGSIHRISSADEQRARSKMARDLANWEI